MTCVDHFHPSLDHPTVSDASLAAKYSKSADEVSLSPTTIDIVCNKTPSFPSIWPTENQSNQKRKFFKKTIMTVASRPTNKRKELYSRLCLVSNFMCLLALLGIVLMIIENEITFFVGHNDETLGSWLIKLIISISTIALISLIIYYHKLDMSLYLIKNSVEDWHIALTGNKIFFIILEILICIIHPIPRHFPPNWSDSAIKNSTIFDSSESSASSMLYTDIDVVLGLPMFGRLYLVCRFMMFHSDLIRNPSSQSLSSLNQVSMNFFFLVKICLEQWPTRCLIIFGTLVFSIGSWSLRACDYQPTSQHIPFVNSMWLFIITFTTVGYGDITPSTYCGRTIAAIVALLGILLSALLVSVFAQKLVLTRWEKYVHTFVLNIQLTKQRKNQAANIIKFAVKVWYFKRKGKPRCLQCIKAQWKLFRSICALQIVKCEQRQLTDSCVVLADVFTVQQDGNIQTEKLVQQMNTMNITLIKSKRL